MRTRSLAVIALSLAICALAVIAYAQDSSPIVTTPPATGQQESPIPRRQGNGTYAAQWNRWDINAHFNGAAAIDPLIETLTFADLGTAADGRLYYCSDCQQTIPCDGSGSGAWAFGAQGQWQCTAPAPGVNVSGPLTGSGIGGTPVAIYGVTSEQGSGSKLQLSNAGATVANHCVAFDSSGNTIDSGTNCSSLPYVVNSASSYTVNWGNGYQQNITLINGAQSFSMTGQYGCIVIKLTQPASGAAGTVSSWGTVEWGRNGSSVGPPTLCTGNGDVDRLGLCYDGSVYETGFSPGC